MSENPDNIQLEKTQSDGRAPTKVLIIGPAWVGDMVMSQSLFIALQQLGGESVTIDVLAPGWSKPLLERMPEVRRAIELPVRHRELALGKRYQLGKSLRSEAYDQVIVLPNSFKSALLPLFARIPLRTGWRGEMRDLLLNDCRVLSKERLPLMVQRFVALAHPASVAVPEHCPRPTLQVSAESVQAVQQAFDIAVSDNGKRLILCPGAEFGDSKQWPASHYAGLAQKALLEGWQVLLVGSANDEAVATAIRRQLPATLQSACLNLAGRTSLAQVIDLLSTADAVVSNDSGLMHIAAALQRPLLAIYGSTSADFTPPLADRVKLLASDIECRPCFQRTCPLGHKRCLTELSAEMAWLALQQLLDIQPDQ